jgi:hypothetical protein
LPARTITTLPPDITVALFLAGNRKLVLLEGPSDCDVFREWYRDQLDSLEFYDASGVINVRNMLEKALEVGTKKEVFGIIDRDFRTDEEVEHPLNDPSARLFLLRRYSIENYVLEPEAWNEELRVFYGKMHKVPTKAKIETQLLELCKQLRPIMAVNWILSEAGSESEHLGYGYDISQRASMIQYASTALGCTIEEAEVSVQEKERSLDTRLTTLDSAHTCTNGKHLWHRAYALYVIPIKPNIPPNYLLRLLARSVKPRIHPDIRQIVEERILGGGQVSSG